MLVIKGRQRSFGRTSSRMSVLDQEKLDSRLAHYAITHTDDTIDLTKSFPNQTGQLIVELGIGNGASIANRAKQNPSDRFIGVEVYKNGLKTLVINAEQNEIDNLRIINDDARHTLEQLDNNSVDELIVLYPDPWPKKRQNKRRIINQEFLTLADQVIKKDGTLFLTTDIPDYAMWMLREAYTHDSFFPVAISPLEWSKEPKWWLSTKYEKKALQAGRNPWYMTFKRGVDRSNTKCDTL